MKRNRHNKSKGPGFRQIHFKSVNELRTVLRAMEGKGWTYERGDVILTYGLSEYDFNRGLHYINIYDNEKRIAYSLNRHKSAKLIDLKDFISSL